MDNLGCSKFASRTISKATIAFGLGDDEDSFGILLGGFLGCGITRGGVDGRILVGLALDYGINQRG